MTKKFKHIELYIDNNVALVNLNRPEVRNAIDEVTIKELSFVFQNLNNDSRIRVVVLSSVGKDFCAGADLNWMKRSSTLSYEKNLEESRKLAQLLKIINTSDKVTIAKVFGNVFGGGIGLMAACDYVVASENTKFAFSEVKLGLIPATISPFVVNRIGIQNAKVLMLTGEVFKSARAAKIGLVDYVVENLELNESVTDLVKTLAAVSGDAQVAIKQLLKQQSQIAVTDELMDKTAEILAKNRVKEHAVYGINTFLNKQKPDWINFKNRQND